MFKILKITSPTQLLCQICQCSTLLPFSDWQEIVFHARHPGEQQTHFLKQNFSETITPINESCVMLFNLWTNPVVCWFFFLCWCWWLFRIFTSVNSVFLAQIWQGMPWEDVNILNCCLSSNSFNFFSMGLLTGPNIPRSLKTINNNVLMWTCLGYISVLVVC